VLDFIGSIQYWKLDQCDPTNFQTPDRALNTTYTTPDQTSSQKNNYNRADAATIIYSFEKQKHDHSQRDFARKSGIPRSTLRHWIARKQEIDADRQLTDFLESPVGTGFLHRLVAAAHFEFTKNGTASIHNVSNFLKMAGVSPFIASSYSTQRRVSNQMDDCIINFGDIETKRLGKTMPAKKITLCEDETFHPEICLVAIEPVSNFILVEKYAENRESKTWDKAVSDALEDLPAVEVVQVTSDEGRSLISHALKGLKVHHSSDCFHVIQEIGKGTNGALASKVKKAEKDSALSSKQTLKQVVIKQDYDSATKRPRGRRPDFEKKVRQAEQQEQKTENDLDQALLNQDAVRCAKAEIGQVYHPYNLDNGKKQDQQTVSILLQDCFDRINAAIVGLSDRCKDRVDKAHRVVKNMVGTIAFFFHMVDLCLDNMQLKQIDRSLMYDFLIPGYYLKQAAEKEKDIERKNQIVQNAERLLSVVTQKDGPFSGMSGDRISQLEKVAQQCVQFFQRSSSCTEGRNAQLALRHQGIHRLGTGHLKALTIVHNFYIRRRDGTTAAERLFETKHNDLFEFVLNNVDYPARPRNRLKLAS